MTFREPEVGMTSGYDEGYLSRGPPDSIPNPIIQNAEKDSNESFDCLAQFSWLATVFSRIKNWLITIGRSYVYFLVIIILITLLPTLLVRF